MSYAAGGWSPAGTGQRRDSDPLWTERTDGPPSNVGEPSANAAWAYLREAVLFRMQKLSFNHAMVVADKPQGRLPGPHAVALLYGAEGRSYGSARQFEIFAATRMFQDTDDERPKYNVRDVTHLLANLTEIAEYHYRAGGWNPLDLTDRAEPMPASAQFVGIGVSSLGSPGQNWTEVRSGFGLQLPSHCDIRLADGTWIEMSRDGSQSQTKLNCNRLLSYMSGFAQGPMIPIDYQPRPDHPHAWMDRIAGVVDACYAERARRAGPRPRGREATR